VNYRLPHSVGADINRRVVGHRFQLEKDFIEGALSKEKWWARFVFWSAAGVLGILAVLLAQMAEWANAIFLRIYEYSHYLPFAVCPIGFTAAWLMQDRLFKGSEGSGIPQVIACLRTRSTTLRDQLLSIRVLIGKFICTLIGLLSGASIGREGPTVQMGASLFNFLGHYARFSKFERRQGLIIAGAAAGIAAAFNAPLAGIVFAIEELKGSFEERTSGLMLSAVILSGLMAIAIMGQYSYFGVISVGLTGIQSAVCILIIGALGGAAGGLFSRMILSLKSRLSRVPKEKLIYAPLSLGMMVATIGFFSKGQTFGTGYRQAQQLLEQTDHLAILFPFLKFLATVASYASGIAGGIFAPSLAVGAGIGSLLSPLFSDYPKEALLLLGMVSYLSGVIRVPVTSFVIVYEMTINHLLLFPLMACAFIAIATSKLVCKKSLYAGLAEQFLAGQQDSKTADFDRP